MKQEKQYRTGKAHHALLMIMTIIGLFMGVPAGHGAGLLIADGGFGGRLEIVEHDVSVTINHGVAITEVTQEFKNLENRQVEALYTFPVPRGASVSNFSMWINGREMIGEVLEKERAREIYNSYKRTRRDPGLLEQVDFKTFEMRVFPIGPNATQRVQITYYQELNFDHDRATYIYPLSTVAGDNVGSLVEGRFAISLDIRSQVPIAEVDSPSHPNEFLFIQHAKDYCEASLENQKGDLSRDFVLSFLTVRPVTGIDMLVSRQNRDDGFFCMTVTAGQELDRLDTGADYVFILDVSGSMAHESKLITSRASIESFLQVLQPEDSFEVITFNRQPYTAFGQLMPADEEFILDAEDFLTTQEARGGTSLRPALTAAARYGDPDRTLNMIILSDGMTEQEERSVLLTMAKSLPSRVRIFCIGVGNEVNRPLLEQLAEDAGGLAAFISRGDDFDRQAESFYRKLLRPAVADLELTVRGVDIYDLTPKTLPNLYHGMPLRIYGRYGGQGSATMHLTGTVNGRPFEIESKLKFDGKNDDNPGIERMWAWRKLQQLDREYEMYGYESALNDMIRLGEEYSIVSEYTSFIVLENDGEYKRWKIKRRNALRQDRDRSARDRTLQELQTLRDRAMGDIGPVNTDNGKPTRQDSGQPRVNTSPGNNANDPAPADRVNRSQQVRSRSHRSGGGLGGGAVDPFTAVMILIVSATLLIIRRN